MPSIVPQLCSTWAAEGCVARIVQEIKERRPLTINCRLLLLCNLALGLALLHLPPPFHLPSLSFSSDLQSGKVKAGRSRFQFLQAIQKSTNCAKYASIHPHGYPPAHIAFWESAKKSGIVWKSIYPVVTQTMQRVDMIWEPGTPSCEDGVAKVRHLVLWLHKWSLSAVKEGHALNGSGPRNPSSPSDVSETRVKYKRQKEQWIKSHLYFCSPAFVTQGPLNSCASIGLETEEGTIKKTVAGSLSQVHHVCHIAQHWRNSDTVRQLQRSHSWSHCARVSIHILEGLHSQEEARTTSVTFSFQGPTYELSGRTHMLFFRGGSGWRLILKVRWSKACEIFPWGTFSAFLPGWKF